MGHSVRSHLGIEIRSYDETIRRFIPGYEAMLEAASRELVRNGPELVLDLGAGTGALAEAVLSVDDAVTVELLDVDPEMLAQARERLSSYAGRARFSEISFLSPLPPCDGAAASLSLHHIPTMEAKRTLYRNVYEALVPGGAFVNADAAVSAEPAARAATFRCWVKHMVASGIKEREACRHLEQWGAEDTYFPLEEELAAFEAAGFVTRCPWRKGPIAVVVGRKPR